MENLLYQSEHEGHQLLMIACKVQAAESLSRNEIGTYLGVSAHE